MKNIFIDYLHNYILFPYIQTSGVKKVLRTPHLFTIVTSFSTSVSRILVNMSECINCKLCLIKYNEINMDFNIAPETGIFSGVPLENKVLVNYFFQISGDEYIL